FTHRITSASASLQPGGVVGFEVGASHETVRVDDRAAFFDHDAQALRVALAYALALERSIALGYVFDRVPTPSERPEAALRAHTVEARLYGEVLPLLRAEASAGNRQQTNPNAAAGGRQYHGSVFAARLVKDFTPGTALGLSLGRSTPVSNFEGNGFYITTSAQGDISTTLPFGLVFRASAGWQRNAYRTVAAAIGRPRE